MNLYPAMSPKSKEIASCSIQQYTVGHDHSQESVQGTSNQLKVPWKIQMDRRARGSNIIDVTWSQDEPGGTIDTCPSTGKGHAPVSGLGSEEGPC